MASSHSTSILVTGLTAAAEANDIDSYFGQAGKVQKVDMSEDKLQLEIFYENHDTASKALAKFQGKSFRGDQLHIELGTSGTKIDLNDLFSSLQSLDPESRKALATLLLGSSSTDSTKGKSDFSNSKSSEAIAPGPCKDFTARDIPRLPNFSGEDTKGESTYFQWKFEVDCLLSEGIYSEPLILLAIRRSLKGAAASVLSSLGLPITIDKIVNHFDFLFGSIASKEQLLENFCVVKQRKDETVGAWACRLQELMARLISAGSLTEVMGNDMLRERFWTGLYDKDIKLATRHNFQTKAPFSDLLVSVRTVEHELKVEQPPSKAAGSQQHVVGSIEQKLDQLLSQMRTMDGRIQKLEKNSHNNFNPNSGKKNNYRGRGRGRGRGAGKPANSSQGQSKSEHLNQDPATQRDM